ncbi:MAG: exosortase/archaeosortase family protein [Planctomycetes bacterium]|nr:exosortase/archaeosortase family protein [Planctomycetota bacterium]
MRVLLAIGVPLVLAYATTVSWVVRSWFYEGSYYAHGPLVALLAAAIVWARRRRFLATPGRLDPRGWLLLGPGLLGHLAGAALTIDSVSAASMLLSVPGAVLLAGGPRRFAVVASVVGLLPFMLPMPLFVTGKLAFELKEFAVGAGLALANAFGLGGERVMAEIHVPGVAQPLLVADPCSGLRSLVALITLGYCLAFFTGSQTGARRWLVLAVSGPVAIATNVVRIAAICWLARSFGADFATGTGHDVLNILVWCLDLGILVGLDAVWTRLRRRFS